MAIDQGGSLEQCPGAFQQLGIRNGFGPATRPRRRKERVRHDPRRRYEGGLLKKATTRQHEITLLITGVERQTASDAASFAAAARVGACTEQSARRVAPRLF